MKIKSVRLAKPMARDSRFVLALRNRPEVRAASGNAAVITVREHAAWWCTCKDPIYVIKADDRRAGYVRLDGAHRVSIALMPWARGRGIASRALRALRRRHQHHTLLARIRVGNESSIRLFASCGYQPLHVWAEYRCDPVSR